jgi:acyl-CoA-binding protein
MSESFEQAVAWVSVSAIPTSSETKLRLYALYKIATSAPRPSTSRPGIFDFQGRAKWDSWTALGSSPLYEERREQGRLRAKEDYVEEAVKMGWNGRTAEAGGEEGAGLGGDGTEDLPLKAPRKQAGGGGMVSVSAMLQEDEDDDA